MMNVTPCPQCKNFHYSVISGPSSPTQAKQNRGIVLTKVNCTNCGHERILDLTPSIEASYSDFMLKSACGLLVAPIVFLTSLFSDSTFFTIVKYLSGAYLVFGLFDILRVYIMMKIDKM